MSYNYTFLNVEAKARYEEKLTGSGLESCPYMLPGDLWINDPKKWPQLEYPDIYEYLINTPGIHTKEAMKNRKSLEAYNYFISGWVRPVLILDKTDSAVAVLKADVRPSQRVNNEMYTPWISISRKDNSVLFAHCNCMAGLGESCSHIAAVLFKIEAAVRCGYTQSACTDEACKWNDDFTEKITPAPVSEIKFFSENAAKNVKSKEKSSESEVIRSEVDHELLNDLHSLKKPPVILSSFANYCSDFVPKNDVPPRIMLPPGLRQIYANQNTIKSPNELTKLISDEFEKMKMNEATISYIENLTRKQSGSPYWHEYRCGRITASVAYDVLHTDICNPSKSLIKRLTTQSSVAATRVPSLKWGLEHEKVAFEAYKNLAIKSHIDLGMECCGMRLGGDNCFLGATPDGIVTCQCHGTSLLEIKCPYTARETTTLAEAIDLANGSFFINKDGTLKTSHRHYCQVQIQLYVFNCEECHFVVWAPKWMHAQIIKRDDIFIDGTIGLLRQFITHVLPELLTRRLENSSLATGGPSTSTAEPEKLYCYCRSSYSTSFNWIGCDSTSCQYEWFHLSCAKVSKIPKGKWYCRECKKNKALY